VKVTVLCVGKLKEKFFDDAVKEYCKRLSGYCKIEVTELPEQRLSARPSAGEVRAALDREAEALLRRCPPSSRLIALCVEGKGISSEELAEEMERAALSGRADCCFVIGGSYGLSPLVKEKADLRLSMSKMTFPHHLARIMLLEQIYRAFKIRSGEEYHK